MEPMQEAKGTGLDAKLVSAMASTLRAALAYESASPDLRAVLVARA